MKSCEELNPSLSEFVGFPSSDCVSSEGEMVEYLKKIVKVMEERKYYPESARQICEDVRMEDLNKYKEIIKKEETKWGGGFPLP